MATACNNCSGGFTSVYRVKFPAYQEKDMIDDLQYPDC